jgi:flagellar basal-body rod protein FlgF
MENALLIGLSQQTALQRNLDIIAHNLANMGTVAYKAERPLFRSYLTDINDVEGRPDQAQFVSDYGMVRDTSEGALKRTGNELDVAISGQGYFAVQTAQGERYTRNGHLRIDGQGQLTTSDGDPILDTGNAPITFSPDEKLVAIARDGSISTTGGVKGKLLVVQFENEALLSRIGGSLYEATETPTPATNAIVQQGMIEESNVLPIIEMTTMVELMRAYNSTAQLIRQAEEMTQRAVHDLGNGQ